MQHETVPTPAGVPAGNRYNLSNLPPNQRLAWRSLALEIYRGHDRIFSGPRLPRRNYDLALRRLKAALPSLRQMQSDPLLKAEDRAYLADLVRRVERCIT